MEAAVAAASEQQLEASMRSIIEHELHMSYDDVMRAVQRQTTASMDADDVTAAGGNDLTRLVDLVVSDYVKQQFHLVSKRCD